MKKFLTLLLTLCLLLSCGTAAFADGGRFSHFLVRCPYTENQFVDVPADAWYGDALACACKMGIIEGESDTEFAPQSPITLAETVKIAAVIRSLFATADDKFDETQPWYRSYADYALTTRLITAEPKDYDAEATRGEFAAILAQALPSSLLESINRVDTGAIPDVSYADRYAGCVYLLYRAGVLTGCDETGSFCPQKTITRAEAVAIIGRLMDESQRREFTLTVPAKDTVDGEWVFSQCSDAVFYLELLDANGDRVASASGFFIDADGTALTCWHAIVKGVSARVQLNGSEEYIPVEGIYDFDVKQDWAVIKVQGSGYPYLEIGSPATVVGGGLVYTLGSPLGMQNTISMGLICNPLRHEDGADYILFSAPISQGSSGCPVLNKYGQVIGITAATYTAGQNLNLAVPITAADEAVRDGLLTVPQAVLLVLEEAAG